MARKETVNYKQLVLKNVKGCIILAAVLFCIAAVSGKLAFQSIAVNETIPGFRPFFGGSAFKLNSEQESTGLVITTAEEVKNAVPVFVSTINADDITYQPETDLELNGAHFKEDLTADDINQMKSIDYLKKKFYIVDKRTDLTAADMDAEEFLKKDFSIDQTTTGPKILLFHTHSTEGFADSDMTKDMNEGIWGVGEELKRILEEKYGISVLHDTGRYDIVDGKGQILGAYERMEPSIRKILDENPSIEVVIDLHRDGVNEGTHLVKTVDGKECAQVMFFNGLCKLNKNGQLAPIEGLSNPYVRDNLALSFNAQLLANARFPGFTRRVYVNAYRYSLHMKPKSMLIEVGAQTNTKQEAKNAMEPLAEILATLFLQGSIPQ